MKNYYKTLGISRNAAKEEINKAFRELAFRYHPDRNSDQISSDKFKEINEAKQVLLNDFKRFQYDDALAYFQQKNNVGYAGNDFKRKRVRKRNVHLELIKDTVLNKFFLAAILVITVLFTIASYKIPDEESIPESSFVSRHSTEIKKEPQLHEIQADYSPETIKKEPGIITAKKMLLKSKLTIQRRYISKRIARKEYVHTITKHTKHLLAAERKSHVKSIIANPAFAPDTSDEKASKKQLTYQQMIEVLNKIKAEKQRSASKANCIQLIKSTTSNISNAFMLASFLKGYGFVISGREKIPEASNGIHVKAMSDCISVTVGTLD